MADEPARPPTLEEHLTEEFHRWEVRGRGWDVWGIPVALEPPFRPFLGHTLPAVRAGAVFDDARKPTFFGSLIERLRGSATGRTGRMESALAVGDRDEPLPEEDDTDEDLTELHIALPPDARITKERAERFLLALSALAHPVSFEVIGQPGVIRVALACRASDARELRSGLQAYFPEVSTSENTGAGLARSWDSTGGEPVIVDFGLSREFMLPLKRPASFEVDPLIAVAGVLGDLGEGEIGLLQILFQVTHHPWAPSILRAVTDGDGDAFFADAPEFVPLAREKVSRPLFAAVVRVAARSRHHARTWAIVRALGGSLAQFASPATNEFIPLANDDYPDDSHEEDLLRRQTRRSGMILSSDELASLVHPPSASVEAEALARETRKTKAAPAIARGEGIVLGENVHRGKRVSVSLPAELRTRHTYVVGATGTGKSTLLLQMILQDIERGEGVGVLDPHGDLIDSILARIPEERLADIVLFDPADEEFPLGFNILQAHSELEKNLLASDLVAVFRRLSTSWGDQMTSVLGNAILAFLESERGGTLLHLRRFLVDREFRHEFLKGVGDPEVVYYYIREFPLLTGRPAAPILTRLDAFLRPKLIRFMVGQREGRFDLGKVMDERKIFLAKLAQGAIGEENSYLLGSLLVAKFHQLALARQAQREEERRSFFLYLDEFHNFATPSLATLLSGARKYHLGLVLAHHELRQLAERDPGLVSAVLTNPATRICFRLGDFDAQKLAVAFASFGATDLQRLGIGEAIARIERADWDFNLRTSTVPSVDQFQAAERRARVIALSREMYARHRADVEAELREAHAPSGEEPARAREQPGPSEAPAREARPDEPEHKPEAAPRTATAASPPRYEPKARPRPPMPEQAPLLGRGGPEHKYLQHLVKRLAEDRGWRATIEQPILGGAGSVDVGLERDGRKIACEISVASTPEQEFGNIQKCLAGGYNQVLVISSDKKVLRRIQDLTSGQLSDSTRERVVFASPDEVLEHLDALDQEAMSRETTVHGYKVKVSYKPMSAADTAARKQAIARVLAQGSRRVRQP